MYKKMLVLLDGSKMAEIVFTYAQELSGRLNMTLDLLHVCSPQEAEQLPMHEAYMERMAEIVQGRAAEIRVKLNETIEEKDMRAQGKVVVGYPAEEILKYADANDIDLIMMSTHGRSGVRIWGLGSVAEKVIHASRIPIWLVPSDIREEVIWDRLQKKTIVVPLDGSKFSATVIPHVINIIRQRESALEVVLLYVEDPRIYVELASVSSKQVEADHFYMRNYLEEQVQRLNREGIASRAEMLVGNPASQFISYIEKNPAQLIAMSTHGHAGISRMIFGSFAENVLHLVKKTPILLIKPPDEM